jgi:hypothetical protein
VSEREGYLANKRSNQPEALKDDEDEQRQAEVVVKIAFVPGRLSTSTLRVDGGYDTRCEGEHKFGRRFVQYGFRLKDRNAIVMQTCSQERSTL